MLGLVLFALAVIAVSAGVVTSVVVAAVREQARYAAASRRLHPVVGELQEHVRALLNSLAHEPSVRAFDRPALRQACKELMTAISEFTQSPEFEVLRSSEAGELLERLEFMLDDLSASAWICLGSLSGPGAKLASIARLGATALRLCGQVEHHLGVGFPGEQDEGTAHSVAPGLRDRRIVRAAMRRLAEVLYPPELGRDW